MKALNEIYQDFISLFFPNSCYACDRPIYHNKAGICVSCLNRLPFTNFHHDNENLVEKTFWGRLEAKAATALFYFHTKSRVQHLIHQLKYKNKPEIGVYLGNMLGQQLKNEPRFAQIDGIVPVPLHQKKILLRGYNQAEKIAEGVAEALQVKVYNNILVREINTQSQTRKSRLDRYFNMKEVFKVQANQSQLPKNLLIVDDVVTTGSTIEACGLALQKAKISVYIATLAYADH